MVKVVWALFGNLSGKQEEAVAFPVFWALGCISKLVCLHIHTSLWFGALTCWGGTSIKYHQNNNSIFSS